MFFLLLWIPFLAITPYWMKNIYDIVENTKASKPEYEGPEWADFLLIFITLPWIATSKCLCYYLVSGYYERNLPSKYQGEIRQVKILKGCENIFKMIYFVGISIYGYTQVIQKLPFDSPVIGNGKWENYFIDFPYVPFLRATTYYCLLNFSYHLETSIQMFFVIRNDFYEMFCHHSMALLTISIAYITNYNNLALPFMLIIDFADIFVGLMRVCLDIIKSKTLILTIYFMLMSSWAYTRLYIFPFEIILKGCIHTVQYAKGRLTPHYFMTGMLCVLAILNLYWFLLMGRMGYRFISGQSGPVDLQKNDEATKLTKKST